MNMVDENRSELVEGIRSLYQADAVAKRLIDWFHIRKKSSRETTSLAVFLFTGFPSTRSGGLFKKLESVGLGKFIVGRKGAVSRIKWNYDIKSIAEVALGESDVLEPVPEDALPNDDRPEGMVKHKFILRPNLTVYIDLPDDLTSSEADRLSTWIKSTPFD